MVRTGPACGMTPPTGFRTRVLAALASGALLGVSYPPSPWGPLAWVALVPLMVGLFNDRPPRAGMVEAFATFVTAGGLAFGWIFWHPSLPVVLASLGALLTWAVLMTAPWAGAAWLPLRPSGRLLVLASGLLCVEGLLTHTPWPMPWALVGHTQAAVPWIRPLAALGGVPLLTAWVLGANAALAFALQTRYRTAGLLGSVLILALAAGGMHLAATDAPDRHVPVLLVQPNAEAEAWADASDQSRVGLLHRLTRSALDTTSARPALIVWPETALPPDAPTVRDSLQRWVNRIGVPLLTGAVAATPSPNRFYQHANRALLLRPVQPPQRYDKVYPVPFVEHVPLVDRFAALRALRIGGPGVQGYQRGTGAVRLTTDTLAIGPLICFESVLGPHARLYASGTPPVDMMVTVAQTGWWSDPWPARQHAAFSRLRSVELGRALVLATVRGPSVVFGPSGGATVGAAWDEESVVLARVPADASRSLYATVGDWMVLLALFALAAGIGTAVFGARPPDA